jgi:hypothetical protein
MRQKYVILKNDEKNELILRAFTEIDNTGLVLACEETYDEKIIKSTIPKGKNALISILRTQNIYPPGLYAEIIAESVMELYNSKNINTKELLFDDMTFLKKGTQAYKVTDNIEYEEIESDEILDYDFNINYETKDTINEDVFILNFEEDELIDIECDI